MRIKQYVLAYLMLFVFSFSSISQEVETISPQDIIDLVNGSIDEVNCGLDTVSAQAQAALQQRVDEINETIHDILAQYDLECLERMLHVSFTGIFNINFQLPSLCEIIDDAINSNPLFPDTPEAKSFQSLIKENIQKKEQFKYDVEKRF